MESESVSLESNFDFSHGEYGMVDFFSSRYLFCETFSNCQQTPENVNFFFAIFGLEPLRTT